MLRSVIPVARSLYSNIEPHVKGPSETDGPFSVPESRQAFPLTVLGGPARRLVSLDGKHAGRE